MIGTYYEKERIVQAMRLTGTLSSARSLCHWLSCSQWNIKPLGDGTYQVLIPDMYSEENVAQRAVKGCWIVRQSTSNVTILTEGEFKERYRRI